MMGSPFPRLRAFAKRLRRADRGVALIEAAFVLPVMVVAFFATVEVTQTIIAKRKLNLVVYTVGDLASQSTTIGASDITAIFGSASAVMAPLSSSALQLRVSSVIVYPLGNSCIDWSQAQNMTALKPGTSMTLPTSITNSPSLVARDFIVAEGTLPFNAGTHGFVPGTTTLYEGPTFIIPRQSDRVTGDATIQSSSPCA